MATAENTELIDTFEEFFRDYYHDEIGVLAQKYPKEQRSLEIDWDDLFRFDPDLADDYLNQPDQLREHAEEALRLYDLPIDVNLGQAHVRIRNLPEITDIRAIRADDVNTLVSVQGIVRKATDVRPKVQEAAFRCQRCETLTRVPQSGNSFREPHECRGCDRQGPFRLDEDQSRFIDAQRLRVQENPEGLRGGETPQSIDVDIEDDITGEVSPGDRVRVTGVLRLSQEGGDDSPVFDVHMEGVNVRVEEEEFEDMEITDEDKQAILDLSNRPDIYDRMINSVAPSIHGYEQEKLAMTLQLFSGVTKHLPDDSRIRGDLHMLLIGDPGTGKCLAGDTEIRLQDGTTVEIGPFVESHLEDPVAVDDGYYAEIDIEVPTLHTDGSIEAGRAVRVWKREAPERMWQIRTKNGQSLEMTPSHPLFVLEQGTIVPKKATELTEGTWIGTAPETTARQESVVPVSGDRLQAIRTALEIEPSECGLSETVYLRCERGEKMPSQSELRKITAAFRSHLQANAEPSRSRQGKSELQTAVPDGGTQGREVEREIQRLETLADGDVQWDRIESITSVPTSREWVYDLEVQETHNYISAGIISHNSQLLQYISNIAPRSVYTSGKGSSAAGLTAAAVRDDFGDGQQWTLEAGALVLADQGVAAVDELDKMASDDRSAMHEALEQQSYHPQTELLLADGRRIPIGELVDQRMADRAEEVTPGVNCELLPVDDLRVHTVDTDERTVTKTSVERISRHEAPETFVQVTFTNGRSITVTPEHPMFVGDDQIETVPATAVSPGDTVPAPQRLPNAPGGQALSTAPDTMELPETLTPPLAEWLGMIMAGGQIAPEDGLLSYTGDNRERVERLAETVCLPQASTEGDQGTVQWHSAAVTDWLVNIAPEMEAPDRRVPAVVLGSSRDHIRRFLIGVLSGTPDEQGQVALTAETKPLARDYADLLAKLGIATRIQKRDTGSSYRIELPNHEEITERLIEQAGNLDRNSSTNESVPGLQTVEVADVTYVPNEGEHACDWVYDITVEPTHTFISQGVVLHNSISVSKAGINATLKSRCSLLGAANPTYGRFDQYEPIGEQIDLEPALISRFDLIFTVTDQPDPEEDRRLAQHILETNYAGQLNTQREELTTPDFSEEQVDAVQETAQPDIDPELLKKYVAYAQQTCYPRLTENARNEIEDFYVELRSKGADEDSPVPVTARKLEALVRLAEASARVRLSDEATIEDAQRVIDIVKSSLQDISVDPETGQYDADVIETGTSKSQRDRIRNIKNLIEEMEDEYEGGVPIDAIVERAEEVGLEADKAEREVEKLKQKGEVYEPQTGQVRTT